MWVPASPPCSWSCTAAITTDRYTEWAAARSCRPKLAAPSMARRDLLCGCHGYRRHHRTLPCLSPIGGRRRRPSGSAYCLCDARAPTGGYGIRAERRTADEGDRGRELAPTIQTVAKRSPDVGDVGPLLCRRSDSALSGAWTATGIVRSGAGSCTARCGARFKSGRPDCQPARSRAYQGVSETVKSPATIGDLAVSFVVLAIPDARICRLGVTI
jgi:hypothetical protein